jgi:hypothetical protein
MYFQIIHHQWLAWVQKAHPGEEAVKPGADDFVGRSQINHPSPDLQIGHLEVGLW